MENLLADAPDAIAAHLAALKADGQPMPHDVGVLIATVRADASAA